MPANNLCFGLTIYSIIPEYAILNSMNMKAFLKDLMIQFNLRVKAYLFA